MEILGTTSYPFTEVFNGHAFWLVLLYDQPQEIFLFNSRSIVNKLNQFQSLAYTYSFDIFAITETWLSESIFSGEILTSNYTIYRCDRSSRGGGVLLAVKDTIPSLLLPTSISNLEVLTVQIGIAQLAIILCLVYIPPGSTVHTCEPLFNHLNELTNKYDSLLILGDFNIPDVNWNTLTATSLLSDSFCDLVFDLNLSQLIDNPTHIQGNILDLILTNQEELIHSVTVHSREAFPIHSDHYPITFKLSFYSYHQSRKCQYCGQHCL